MRWRGQRESDQVEDRRGMTPRRGVALGGGGLLVIVLLALLTNQNPSELVSVLTQGQGPVDTGGDAPKGPPRDELGRFASTVLADTEDVWQSIFRARGQRYELPTLVLFSDAVESACGFNSAAVGPFYCPLDGKVYIDLSFFSELDARFGAPGDFAQAYVIAHEVGHHVQNQLGVSTQVHEAQSRASSESEANALSVRLELQADCLAGVWAHHAHRERNLLEPGDVALWNPYLVHGSGANRTALDRRL